MYQKTDLINELLNTDEQLMTVYLLIIALLDYLIVINNIVCQRSVFYIDKNSQLHRLSLTPILSVSYVYKL